MEQNTPNREGRRELFYERSFTDASRVNNSLLALSWVSALEAERLLTVGLIGSARALVD